MQNSLLQFLFLAVAGWVNRSQQDAIDYLKEENRVLREHLGERRLRFTDEQRRRLAVKAKALGRDGLKEIAELVTPETLLRWYGRLIAKKYVRKSAPRSGTAPRRRNDTRARCPDGEREFELGLHQDSRCAPESRP